VGMFPVAPKKEQEDYECDEHIQHVKAQLFEFKNNSDN